MKVNFLSLNGVRGTTKTTKQVKLPEQQPDIVEIKSKKAPQQKKEPLYKRFKTAIVAGFSSVVTAFAVFAIANKKIEGVKADNASLKDKNKQLKEQFENIVLPENMETQVAEKIEELSSSDLSYSPTEPVKVEKRKSIWSSEKNRNPISVLPQTYEKTTNRSDAELLQYPKFKEGKAYSFEFPTTSEIKINHEKFDFSPIARTLTTVSEAYADSLLWDNNKIARDLLQNFYDGHGQTLDGVKVNVTPKTDGKYTVKIEGKSTFSPDKAILLGESSKKDNANAAGNYGEGLKMVVLKLLREKGAENVDIASANWNVNWQLQDSGLGKKVLAYQLDEVPAQSGNYIQFDTDNVDFIKAIVGSYDKFYHYNNPAFKCPDFENDMLSMQLVEKSEKGKFYIAGQAFEVDGDYDGLTEMNIAIKKKPPQKYRGELIFDPSRDRTSLTNDNLQALGSWVVSEDNMSKEDVIKLIHSLENYWDVGTIDSWHMTLGASFISGVYKGARDRDDLNIKFPSDKYVADSWGVSGDLKNMYKQAGYKICSPYFSSMGMRSITDLVDETRQHKPVELTQTEKNKLLILKDAISLLENVLTQDRFFSKEELDTKIYVFDKNSELEDRAYEHVQGEAIIDCGKSLGFWIERGYLEKADFSEAFATSLHELTHKFGGDSSDTFSYKLTDVMQKVFAAINENPNLAIQMKVLEKAWNEQK